LFAFADNQRSKRNFVARESKRRMRATQLLQRLSIELCCALASSDDHAQCCSRQCFDRSRRQSPHREMIGESMRAVNDERRQRP